MSCKSHFFTLLAELWRIVSSIFILTSSLLLFVYVLHFWYSGDAQNLADDVSTLANGALQSLDLTIVEFRTLLRDVLQAARKDETFLSRLLKFVQG